MKTKAGHSNRKSTNRGRRGARRTRQHLRNDVRDERHDVEKYHIQAQDPNLTPKQSETLNQISHEEAGHAGRVETILKEQDVK